MKEPLTMEQRKLVAEHYKYAERLADRRVRSCLPPEDRRQEAYIGLMYAARTFDPGMGWQFKTYAARRIVGAIIDAERRPGSQLLKLTRWDQRNGGKQVLVRFADSSTVEVGWNDGTKKEKALASIAFVDPEPAPTLDDRDAIDAALQCLQPHERTIAVMYFFAGATMKRIGERVGLSESRVSQTIAAMLERLREHTALSHYAKGA